MHTNEKYCIICNQALSACNSFCSLLFPCRDRLFSPSDFKASGDFLNVLWGFTQHSKICPNQCEALLTLPRVACPDNPRFESLA